MQSAAVRVAFIVLLLASAVSAATDTHVVIMHTNDLRGHVLPGANAAGSAKLATVVRQMKPDLMLDAGGMLSGSLISDMFLGAPVIDVMNAIGYDAAGVGSTEFSF